MSPFDDCTVVARNLVQPKHFAKETQTLSHSCKDRAKLFQRSGRAPYLQHLGRLLSILVGQVSEEADSVTEQRSQDDS